MANALGTPNGVVSDENHRADLAALIAPQASSLAVRTGVMMAPGSTTLVTGTATTGTMTVSVAAHHWISSRSVADGVYIGTKEAAGTANIAAAPGSNSRIDVVWAKQNDTGSTVSPDTGTTQELYGVTTGTASLTPSKPAIPVGAVELATVQVAAGATKTNGAGVTITNTARQTVARGAPVPVGSQAERDALTKYKGLQVVRLDTSQCRTETWNGAKWCFMIRGEGEYATSGLGILQVAHGGGQTPIAHGGTPGPQTGTYAENKNQVITILGFYRDATFLNFRANRTDGPSTLTDDSVFLAWWAEF